MRALLTQPKALIMGIINVTPDSFSDGGRFLGCENAVSHALELVSQGADILDIGGESTRPGAEIVSEEEELDRVVPVIEALVKETSTPISIDTSKPTVMRAAVKEGAHMVNDVNGLLADGAIEQVAELNVPVCIMHRQGNAQTMQQQPTYDNVVDEVIGFLNHQIDQCLAHGISQNDILVDPGIGFGKTLAHNLCLLQAVPTIIAQTGCEALVGVSRKSMFAKLLGREIDQRLPASLGLAVQAVINGAKIIRVHDVIETADAIRSVEAVQNSETF